MGSERFKRFLASESPASLLFRSPPANNLKDRPRLKRAYACVCKLNLSSALHNGYFVASDLIDENLSHRTGAIGIDGIRSGERRGYGVATGIPRPKSRNAVSRRIKHDLTRKSTRFETAHGKDRRMGATDGREQQVKPEAVAAGYGCCIAGI